MRVKKWRARVQAVLEKSRPTCRVCGRPFVALRANPGRGQAIVREGEAGR